LYEKRTFGFLSSKVTAVSQTFSQLTTQQEIKNLSVSKKMRSLWHFYELSLVFSYIETSQQKSTTITTLWQSERTREVEDGMAEVWRTTTANIPKF